MAVFGKKRRSISIEGQNPGNVKPWGKDGVKVDTELPGGEKAARQMFEKLVGKKLPKTENFANEPLPNGGRVVFRIHEKSSEGLPKVEITDNTQRVLEKITFK